MKENIYYSYNDIFSYNKLINFVVSNRGGGKTFGFKNWAIKDFLKNENQFVYLRRYKSELEKDNNIKNFFDDIKYKFPEHEFEVKGGRFLIDKKIAGFYFPLSTGITKKSVSYPKVNKLCFDEFIIEKGNLHYLQGEVKKFLDICETIFRTRDNWKAVLLGNAISLLNPYFLYFNINIDTRKRFTVKNDTIVELYTNEDFIKYKEQTRFGKLIKDTEYGAYSMYNKFVNNNNNFVEKRTPTSKYFCSIKFENINYGIWYEQGIFYCSKKFDASFKPLFVLSSKDLQPNFYLISNANEFFHIKALKKAYNCGCIRYDDIKIKNKMFEIFKLLSFSKGISLD